MGLVFTILFIIATYLSPAVIYPPLAAYRVSFILGVFAIFFSIPGMFMNKPWKLLQSYLWIGLLCIAVISQIVNGWYGGALIAANSFVVNAVVFFLVIANCNTVTRLKWLAGAMCLITAYTIFIGSGQYWAMTRTSDFIQWQNLGENQFGQPIMIHRLRARGTIGDPNDFAQVIAVCITFLFFWYKPKKRFLNLIFVLIPGAYLFYGMALTHSRGSLVGLGILLLMTLRKKLGTFGATALSVGAAIGLFALGFTGGRGVSSADGADRMAAWGAGLMLFKHHPIFGVGFGAFTEHYQLTAHNSFVLCFTELGFAGYFCWLGMIVTAFLGLKWVMARNQPVEELARARDEMPMTLAAAAGASGVALIEETAANEIKEVSEIDPLELRQQRKDRELVHAAAVVRAALIAFLACAWFLSRAYVMTLYIILGMSGAVMLMAMQRDPERAFVPLKKLVRFTVVAEVVSIAFIYLLVRSGHIL